MELKLCVPCLLGLEGPIADELKRLGMDNVASENGRVYFTGTEAAVAAAKKILSTCSWVKVAYVSCAARTRAIASLRLSRLSTVS